MRQKRTVNIYGYFYSFINQLRNNAFPNFRHSTCLKNRHRDWLMENLPELHEFATRLVLPPTDKSVQLYSLARGSREAGNSLYI